MISSILLPICLISLFAYSQIKKNNTYSSFINGAKSSFDLVLTIMPYIVAILIAIEIYMQSGMHSIINGLVSPFFNSLGIPSELAELIIVKNFSGSGSLAILTNIFKTHSANSYISTCAAVIMATSEATFFSTSILLSKTKIEKLRYTIPLALFLNILSAILSCFICKFI